jgi:nitrite reductase/ring-hydroxylating ferredoxin subunit
MAALGALSLSVAGSTAAALLDSVKETEPLDVGGNLRTYTIPAADGIVIDAGNDVMLARWQNRAYAFSLKCPHRGTRLEWLGNERVVFCPKHKAKFQPDGFHDSGRRSRDLDRYEISRSGNALLVDLGTLHQSDAEPEAWKAAMVVLG